MSVSIQFKTEKVQCSEQHRILSYFVGSIIQQWKIPQQVWLITHQWRAK